MKKNVKIVLIIVIIVIFIVAIVILINFFPMIDMKPMETGEIQETGIYAIKSKPGNLFLIQGENGYIMIDAGNDTDTVRHELAQIPIAPSDVKYVFLTHSDYDHVGSLNLFPDAQVFMSEDEMQMLDGSIRRDVSGYNSLPNGTDLNSIRLLTDGQEVKVAGHTIGCIKAPGHTPGCMAYLVDGLYLFTGDAIKVRNNKMTIPSYTMDKEDAWKSIQRFYDIRSNIKLVLTAHYGYYQANELQVE